MLWCLILIIWSSTWGCNLHAGLTEGGHIVTSVKSNYSTQRNVVDHWESSRNICIRPYHQVMDQESAEFLINRVL